MPNTVKAIQNINEILEGSTGMIGLGFAAYRMLYAIWSSHNPGKSFEEYNAYLKTESAALGENARSWFVAHGWQEGPDGHWSAPNA